MGGCVSIHTVRIQVSVVVQTGGKVTCRNSRTARNDSDELGLDPVVIHVSQPLLDSLACCGRPAPRVVIVVQTPPRVTVVVQPGVRHPPRVTVVVPTPCCNDSRCNSRTAPDSTRCSCGVCCGVQPRAVTTRVVIRGRRRTVRVVLAQS